MRDSNRRRLVAAVGAVAAVSTLASAPSYAVTTPGQAVANDYGQSAAEVSAEVAAVVNATPAVITARTRAANARAALLYRARVELKAKAVYVAAVKKRKGKKIVLRAKKAYLSAHVLTGRAAAANASARIVAARVAASTAAAVRATHYLPVDGTYDGAASMYFIPGIGLEPVQVRITVYGGHVSDVAVPVYTTTGDSAVYNAMSIPVLMQEAVHAGDTANVAVVTGASLTSSAFAASLQSALQKAGFPG